MPNANENLDPIPQGDAATEPIDLAQAFKMLNQANRETTEEPVATGDNGSSEQSEPGDGTEQPEGTEETSDASTIVTSNDEGDGSYDGGSADSIEAIDFNAQKQQMLRDIQQSAKDQVRKEFNEQDIGYYSVPELTIRDEQTGEIKFRNPDVQDERNPDYYFKSRAELLQFIEAWNRGVDAEFRKAVNQKQQELMIEQAPRARLIDFIPKWQAMDPTTQQIFDELLQGHEVRDANGQEIGFNVDLNAVASQAERIAKRFQNVPTQTQDTTGGSNANTEAPVSSSPALDMQTGNGKSADEKEPSTIGEALKLIDKQNKKGK